MHERLPGYGIERIDGSKQVEARTASVDRFNHDADARIMLLSLLAGGVGLNLTSANHILILDAHYNPAWEQQASDRIHRIGQVRTATIHTFVCKDSIEERIEKIQVGLE